MLHMRLLVVVHVKTHIDDLLQLNHYTQQCQTETTDREDEVNHVVLVESIVQSTAPIQIIDTDFWFVLIVYSLSDPEQYVGCRQKQRNHVLKNARKFTKTSVLFSVLDVGLRQAGEQLFLNESLHTKPAEKRERDHEIDKPPYMAVLVARRLFSWLLCLLEFVETQKYEVGEQSYEIVQWLHVANVKQQRVLRS